MDQPDTDAAYDGDAILACLQSRIRSDQV